MKNPRVHGRMRIWGTSDADRYIEAPCVGGHEFYGEVTEIGEGWSATVDGEDAELLKTNTMYMGLKLSQGDHVIDLKYNTPGLRVGIILSVTELVITIGIAFFSRRKNDLQS
ncbi:MAG: YfhO family protein [Lachnospiraceae bacterium]